MTEMGDFFRGQLDTIESLQARVTELEAVLERTALWIDGARDIMNTPNTGKELVIEARRVLAKREE